MSPRLPGPRIPLHDAGSIAVLRANGIGDYLMAEPALTALRVAAPSARITLLGGAWERRALQGRPGPVDEVLTVPYIHGIRTPADPEELDPLAQQAFLAGMRERKFDYAFQMHGGGRNSNPVVSSLGAKCTVGLRAADAPALDVDLPYQYWQPEILRYLDVVRLAGAQPSRVEPHLTVMQSDVEAARLALRQAGLDPLGSIAVIHPGARDPRRRWPVEGFAEVADRLHDNGAQIVVIGSGSELDVVAGVLERTRQAVALTTLSFSELVGVLWSARVLVGNDSGPRHLAEAVGTSTCSIYWFGNLLMAGPATRIRHRVHVSWTTTCPQCDQRYVGDPFPGRCYHSVSHVCDVEVEPVAAAALELMASADAREGLGKGALDGAGRY